MGFKGIRNFSLFIGIALAFLFIATAVMVAASGGDLREGISAMTSVISPARRINHPEERAQRRLPPFEFTADRSIDGSGNNPNDPEMGSTYVQLVRIMESDYSDGLSDMAGDYRPGPRTVSNIMNDQENSIPNPFGASDYLWQWGQFIDHDIDLTEGVDPAEHEDIAIPTGDPFFDPLNTGTQVFSFNRSIYDTATGTDSPRQQMNEITAWLDASNVYGSNEERALALRTNDGTGRLRRSAGNLLPFNTEGFPNAGGSSDALFLAGDVRANEQVALTAMHTLFMREHNRLTHIISQENPGFSGDQIYARARKIVGAEIQVITFREFLPALLGPDAIAPYRGYNSNVNANIMNLFSTAAYRFGHSQLSPTLLRLDRRGAVIDGGNLPLRDAFFSPQRITDEGGIEPILRGLASQVCQRVDPFIIDDVRNFLFGAPGSGGFDLAALNIQRGRDHGLPGYNYAREALGLRPANRFADISSNPEIVRRLRETYERTGDVDLWVGGLSEDPVPGAHVGRLFFRVIKMQFEAIRNGDRFWYALTLDERDLRDVESTRLANVIRRNTNIGSEIQDDVFRVARPPRR